MAVTEGPLLDVLVLLPKVGPNPLGVWLYNIKKMSARAERHLYVATTYLWIVCEENTLYFFITAHLLN